MKDSIQSCVAKINGLSEEGKRIAFVSGNFNVVHPGHLRLLNFAAECGDFLVVGVNPDKFGTAIVPQNMRLEGVRSIGIVDYAFLLDCPPEEFIAALKPAVVVKGREHEELDNPERAVVESYGGKLLFTSGEVRFSSLDLLQQELRETDLSTIYKPADYPRRHGFSNPDLIALIGQFESLNVVVIGDLIVDEYINCEPLGMSQEDPTIVVSPIHSDMFVGGAGIVAAHAAGLGANVSYVTVSGDDKTAAFAKDQLQQYGVKFTFVTDDSRPTSLKQRYRAHAKTLLRVSHLRQHDVSQQIAKRLLYSALDLLDGAHVLIFSDFNYGCLPQPLVDELTQFCNRKGVMMVADSQSSSQVGDVSRFKGMRLLTPTEHEARLAVRDQHSGLVVLAEKLKTKANARETIIKLGAEGLLVHAPDRNSGELITDQLPAFNRAPKDVSGAGDSLLTCAALALAAGANIWRSAYLGSVAAACQVGRVGNIPLSAQELISELSL